MAKGLTPAAQKIVAVIAQIEAKRLMASQLLPEHVMLALIKTDNTEAMRMLHSLNIATDTLLADIHSTLSVPSASAVSIQGDLPLHIRIRELMNVAAYEARLMNQDFISTGHLLLALSRETDTPINLFFRKNAITLDMLRKLLLSVTPEMEMRPVTTRASTTTTQKELSALEEFCRDITADANAGKIDPVIGRATEINRIIQILSRRTKNNAVLIGDPGVGKTAIAEGLALRLAADDVPRSLAGKRLLILDMAAVVAGTKFRGEFEDRIKRIIKEICKFGNVIVFIDEMHTLIGAGSGEGSMDASNLIKPALARGEFQCIGATTLAEYRKYIEKDAAFERRFQRIQVNEPSADETLAVLQGIKKRYEEHHGVLYSDESLKAAVTMTARYLTDRFMPDKAIDVLDEAGAMKKIENDVRPPELDELEKEITVLTAEKQEMVQNQNYERAAKVRDRVHILKTQLEEIRKKWLSGENAVSALVTSNDIARVLATMTGIPLERLEQNSRDRLRNLETELAQTVSGQPEALHAVAAAIRRARTGIASGDRPAGSFVFLGPTGVGKTLLAKTLARCICGSENSLIRIDMSDFMEKHNASRLVGAPPGYVGYEEGGILTEKIRRNPYSVVLLDEIEKAHHDIFNLLLQILEEGELKDNLGHTVNFRNTIVIMTSNAGARSITADGRVGFSQVNGTLPYEEIKTNAESELKKLFSPELLNRIDEVVVFHPLAMDSLLQIVDRELTGLQQRLSNYAITLHITDSARTYLAKKTDSAAGGARPLRRILQKELEDPLSQRLVDATLPCGCTVTVDTDKDSLVLISGVSCSGTATPKSRKSKKVVTNPNPDVQKTRRSPGSRKKQTLVTADEMNQQPGVRA